MQMICGRRAEDWQQAPYQKTQPEPETKLQKPMRGRSFSYVNFNYIIKNVIMSK